jgi:GTP-binding protein EngB required for normal cell division
MEKIKNLYLETINHLKDICIKQDMSKTTLDSINELDYNIREYKILFPLIGNFNAGKSSILNAFLSKGLLPTDIRPETAIATEIVFGKSNELKAFKINNDYTTFPLSKIRSIGSDDYLYIQIFDNNDFLQKNKDIVFVDMPGLDSGLEMHNKAILQYIKKGVVFVMIIDVEDGGIRKSTLNFIKEIKQYNLNISILINKIDKKPMNEINKIKEAVEKQVSQHFDNAFVGLVSANTGNIEDFFEIVTKIDKIGNFKQEFEDRFLAITDSMIKELNIRMNSINVGSSELEKIILKLKKSKKELEQSMANESERIGRKFSTESTSKILEKVKQNLRKNSNLLVNALKISDQAFKTEINELLRPALIEATDTNINIIFNETISNIDEIFKKSTKSANALFEINTNDYPKIINEISNLSENLKKTGDNLMSKNALLPNKMGIAYKSIAGILGISTSIVAPWLEVIIMFMPEILNVITKIFGENEDTILRRKVEFEIIPQIMAKLRPKIKIGLENAKALFMENIGKEIELQHQEIVVALEKAINEKKNNEEKTLKNKEILRNTIMQIFELSEKIKINSGV